MIYGNDLKSISIDSDSNSIIQRSLSGKTIRSNRTYQLFTFKCEYPKKELVVPIDDDIIQTLQLPSHFGISTNMSCSGTVNTNTITTDNNIGLDVGMYVKFNHNKLYQVTEVNGVVGGTSFKVYPKLLQTITDVTAVTKDIQINCSVLSTMKVSYDKTRLSTLSIELVEDL